MRLFGLLLLEGCCETFIGQIVSEPAFGGSFRHGLFRFFGGLAMSAMNGSHRSSYEEETRSSLGVSHTQYKTIWANLG